MKTVLIVQARFGSTRLPNKIMKQILDMPILKILLKRLKKCSEVDEVIVALAKDKRNLEIKKCIQDTGIAFFEGSEKDVLDRYYKAAISRSADIVVRITSDCPLSDPYLIDEVIRVFKANDFDYISNTNPPTYPDGFDIEVFSMKALESSWQATQLKYDREHVTNYIINNDKFLKKNITYMEDLSNIRLTLDYDEDYDVLRNVFDNFKDNLYFTFNDVIDLYMKDKSIFLKNMHLTSRPQKGSGQNLWMKAKKIIPGGNMLLSKRSEMFLPNKWPSYFSKSKGCEVWDLDNKKYIDMCLMGVGTNILGYSNEEVNAAVIANVNKGNMTTLNCAEEVELIEKLLTIHSWADMARLARTGGEANAIAVRIARAATGRDKIAICGYHGWHDWYLATNLQDKDNLSNHLLSGLEAKGVPQSLTGSVIPFNYNDFEGLKKIIEENEIGIVKMEPKRNLEPENNFLQNVRELCNKNNVVLIFDECTSGFRETNGGLHKKLEVNPDIAIFGKALGNGFAITAVIGKEEIMNEAQSSFISSTFWTERIGPTAAIKTLEIMNDTKSWDIITNTGNYIREEILKISSKFDIKIKFFGLPSLSSFIFESKDHLKYKTFLTQEMLKKGYLASNIIYVSTAHKREIIDSYLVEIDKIFKTIGECENGKDINQLLDYPVAHSGFERLN